MSDETITPALTADEWQLLRLWNAGKMPGGKVRGMVVLDLPESHVHGAAACALYGQPFGFTREDVEAVYLAADYMEYEDHMRKEDADRARAVADRIAALLPPEDGK